MEKEKKICILIVVLYASNLVFSILYPTYKDYLYSKNTAPIPVEAVTLNTDGSSSFSTKSVSPDPPPFFLQESLSDYTKSYFLLVFPWQFLGIWLLLPLIQLCTGFSLLRLIGHPSILLWLGAVVSIFLLLKYSRGIPFWRRLLYCYLIATQIAAFAAINWSPLGS